MSNAIKDSEAFQKILENNSSIKILAKINKWLSRDSKKEITNSLRAIGLTKFKIRPINSSNEWNTFIKEQQNVYLAINSDGACHLSGLITNNSGTNKRKVLYEYKSLPCASRFFSDISHESMLGIAILKAE